MSNPPTADESRLTQCQIKVLQTVADTSTVQQAAARLGIAPSTVTNHLVNIRRGIGVSTTCQAIAWAFRRGLLK